MTPGYKRRLKQIALKTGDAYKIDPQKYSKGIAICQALRQHGIRTTLGKFSQEGADAPKTIVFEYRQCSNALMCMAAPNSVYLSIKPPALQFNIKHLREITDIALKNGQGIHFDSHGHDQAEPTLRLLKRIMVYPREDRQKNGSWQWGLTLPSRWRRSFADMRWAIRNNVRVRLVKGEFKASRPSEEIDPRKGFLTLIDNMAGTVRDLAIATHDHALAKEAIYRTRNTGTKVELELLFGMPVGKMVALAKEMKVPVRFYVAYGEILLLYGIKYFFTEPQKLLRPKLYEVFGRCESKLSSAIESL